MVEETAKLMPDGGMGLDPAERRLLAGMPLHAITSVHGEAGLRERLAMEIAQFPAADRGRAADALALASRLHAADWRQREPYANHLLRVTIRILSHYRVADPDVACAALLHDAVEDHAAGIAPGGGQAALAVLAALFGARTAALVVAVTNPDGSPAATSTSTTASTSWPAWRPARGPGSSRRPISPIMPARGLCPPWCDGAGHGGERAGSIGIIRELPGRRAACRGRGSGPGALPCDTLGGSERVGSPAWGLPFAAGGSAH